MPGSSDPAIIQGFIEEVESYLSPLRDGLNTLTTTPDDKNQLEEMHRLVHTIKGASALMGVSGLSHITFQMEDALEDIISGALAVTEETLTTLANAIDVIEQYTKHFLDQTIDETGLLTTTIKAFRRLRGLPETDDDKIISQLLSSLEPAQGTRSQQQETRPATTQPFAEQEAGPSDLDEENNLTLLGSLLDEEQEADEVQELGNFLSEASLLLDEELPADLIESPPPALPQAPAEVDQELVDGFYEEAEEHLEEVQRCLTTLEQTANEPMPITEQQRELIRQVRRAVHTVKGASSIVGFQKIANWGHTYEDLLDWLYEEAKDISPSLIDILIDAADLLAHLVKNPQESSHTIINDLKLRFQEFMGERSAAPESVPEPPPALPVDTKPAIDQDLLEGFYQEAEEHQEEIQRCLASLEREVDRSMAITDPQRELIRRVRRAVHTVKGASGIVGFQKIADWAHSFEDLLDWLYEEAKEVQPETVALLLESADLLTSLISNPATDASANASRLRGLFRQITNKIGAEISAVSAEQLAPLEEEGIEQLLPVAEQVDEKAADRAQLQFEEAIRQARKLRVDMDRFDELVNLVGELIIALSGFDQKMDTFGGSIDELELSRERLREIARDLEVGYEVKAIQRLGATPALATSRGGLLRQSGFEEFDTLELDRYSEFNLIIRSLNETAVDVGAINNQISTIHSDFDGYITRQRVLLSELQAKMMQVRMIPLSTISSRMQQTIRDASRKLGKKVKLLISGENIELDRHIWEKLTDPLMHLLRNAVDHGVEPPALRQALGKPDTAILKLAASREGNQVTIRIEDDGSGLNYPAIKKTARKMGWGEAADSMSNEELANLIFQPGFTTKTDISQISGRGVGMDVVKTAMAELKGTIKVTSWENRGTQFAMRIPLTLAVVRALLFSVNNRVMAVALNEVSEVVRTNPDNLILQPQQSLRMGGKIVPIYHLAKILGFEPDAEDAGTNHEQLAMIIDLGGERRALLFDSLVGQREIVIKNLGSHLLHVRCISGATIMGDGSVIPILNLEEVFGMEHVAGESHIIKPQIESTKAFLEILVVDDSVSIRTVVSRLMEQQGWKTKTAKDGLDALEKVRDSQPDLIVLDIEMPRMNGYEFLTALRGQAGFQDIPVIMLTSRTAAKHRDKAIELGASGFMVKPYNETEFIALVKKLTKYHH